MASAGVRVRVDPPGRATVSLVVIALIVVAPVVMVTVVMVTIPVPHVRIDPVGLGVARFRDLAILPGTGGLLVRLRFLVTGPGGPLAGLGLSPLRARGADLGLVPVLGGLQPLLFLAAPPGPHREDAPDDEDGDHDQHDDGDDLPGDHGRVYPVGPPQNGQTVGKVRR